MSILLKHSPLNKNIVKNGLVLWLDGKDFLNSPPTSLLMDRAKTNSITYMNALSNTDFSNGLTGWNGYASTSNVGLAGNYIKFTSNVNTDGISQAYTSIVGHKYYFNFTMKADSPTIGNYGLVSAAVGVTTNSATINTTDTLISGIITCVASYNSVIFGRPSNAPLNMYLKKNVLVVDLTALFGAGNEPTQAWCDSNLRYTSTSGVTLKGNDAIANNFVYTTSSGSDNFGGVVFDGVDDKLTTLPFNNASEMTFIAKVSAIMGASGIILDWRDAGGGIAPIFISNTGYIQYSNGSISYATANNIFQFDRLPHIIEIKVNASRIKIYYDNTLVLNVPGQSLSSGITSKPITIGARYTNTLYLNGKVYSIIVYKRVLTDGESAINYKALR